MKRRSFMGCVAALFAPLSLFKSEVPKLTGKYGFDPQTKSVLTPGYSFVVVDLSDGPVNIIASDGTPLQFTSKGPEQAYIRYGDLTHHIPLTLKHDDLKEFVTACQKAFPRTTLEFYEIYYTTKPNRNYDCFWYSNIYCRSIPTFLPEDEGRRV